MPIAERARLARWRDRLPKSCPLPHEEEVEGQLELARLLKVGGRKRRARLTISDGQTTVILDEKGMLRTRDRITIIDLLRRQIRICEERGRDENGAPQFACWSMYFFEDEVKSSRRCRWPKDVSLV